MSWITQNSTHSQNFCHLTIITNIELEVYDYKKQTFYDSQAAHRDTQRHIFNGLFMQHRQLCCDPVRTAQLVAC